MGWVSGQRTGWEGANLRESVRLSALVVLLATLVTAPTCSDDEVQVGPDDGPSHGPWTD